MTLFFLDAYSQPWPMLILLSCRARINDLSSGGGCDSNNFGVCLSLEISQGAIWRDEASQAEVRSGREY